MRGDTLIRAALGLFFLAAATALYWGYNGRAFSRANDFVPLYVAAQQVGGDHLYHPAAYYEFQQRHFGEYSKALIYSRPPFYALLLAPLAWLGSFEASYAAFTVLRAAAIGTFLFVWPRSQRADAALFLCLSFPVFVSMVNGQDVVVLLPLMALAWRLEERGKSFAAGLAFALCATKFHLLILLPAALIAQGRWGVMRGLAAGAGGLIGLSFVAGGRSWPTDYADLLRRGELHPDTHTMPNLHGLLDGLPAAATWEATAVAATIAGVALAARRGDFAYGLAAASIGSLLVSRHCYVSDLTILLPGLLAAAHMLTSPLVKVFALSWLGPILPLLLMIGRPLSYVPQVGLVLMLGALVVCKVQRAGRAKRASPAAADSAS